MDFTTETYFNKREELKKQLMDISKCFQNKVWESLDTTQKTQAMESLNEFLSGKFKIEPSPELVEFFSIDVNKMGSYVWETHELRVSISNGCNGEEFADTIAHEIRHAYQCKKSAELKKYEEMYKKLNEERNTKTIKTFKEALFDFIWRGFNKKKQIEEELRQKMDLRIEAILLNPKNENLKGMKDNLENYIRAEEDFEGYYAQLVEEDARDFADAFCAFCFPKNLNEKQKEKVLDYF